LSGGVARRAQSAGIRRDAIGGGVNASIDDLTEHVITATATFHF
jgi:hypothetical protein